MTEKSPEQMRVEILQSAICQALDTATQSHRAAYRAQWIAVSALIVAVVLNWVQMQR